VLDANTLAAGSELGDVEQPQLRPALDTDDAVRHLGAVFKLCQRFDLNKI
jgi:hypothetical protein